MIRKTTSSTNSKIPYLIVLSFLVTQNAGAVCADRAPQLGVIRSTSTALQSRECQNAERLRAEPQPDDILWPDLDISKINAHKRRLVEAENACYQSAFDRCYSNLKKSIDLSDLKRRFSAWTKNPSYRMVEGNIHCQMRAYLLAKELTEAGHEVQLMQIENAPTLIAIERDQKTLRYADYGGYHWAVQIQAKDGLGGLKPMILDPQFSDQPISREEYFMQTVGQVCKEGKPSGKSADCNFHIRPAISAMVPNFDLERPLLREQCGWSFADEYVEAIASVNHAKIRTATVVKEAKPGAADQPEVRRGLIRDGWKNKEKTIKEDIERTELFLSLHPSDAGIAKTRSALKKTKADLLHLQERMRQLGFSE